MLKSFFKYIDYVQHHTVLPYYQEYINTTFIMIYQFNLYSYILPFLSFTHVIALLQLL